MAEQTPVSVKVGKKALALAISVEELVEYTVKLDADEMGQTDYHLPGLSNPRFIAVFVENHNRTLPPVEVMLRGSSGDPIPCTPVAVLTGDTNTGMQDATFNGAPALHFINHSEQEVRVTVIAGE